MVARSICLALVVAAATLIAPPAASARQLPEGLQLETRSRAASTKIATFYWGLRTPESAARAELRRVSDPTHIGYRKFRSTQMIAKRFGATERTVRIVAKYARSKGLTPILDQSRLLLRVRGTVAAFERGFNMQVLSGPISNSGVLYYMDLTLEDPELPPRIARLVPNPVWVSVRQISGTATQSSASELPRRTTRTTYPTNEGTLTQVCPAVRRSPYAKLMMSIGQLAKAYRFSSIRIPRIRGDVRGTPLIGVLAVGSGFSNATLAQAKRCFGASAQPQRVRTGGLIGPLPPGGEGTLDPQVVAFDAG